jgi:hypothetical protein
LGELLGAYSVAGNRAMGPAEGLQGWLVDFWEVENTAAVDMEVGTAAVDMEVGTAAVDTDRAGCWARQLA